jgi:RND family efflux transporter MFP subunit
VASHLLFPLARLPFFLRVHLAILGCTILSVQCGGDNSQPVIEPIAIRVQPVTAIERPGYVLASGTVQGRATVDVAFEVSGTAIRVGPEEGDRVRKGEILATLDPTDFDLDLRAARAAADRARDEHERYQKLYDRQSLSPSDYTKVETGLREAEAHQGLAAERLADTRLVAPISGVVAMRDLEPGESVSPGMPVFTIVAIDPIEIRAGIPEIEIGRVHVGQDAVLSIPALGDRTFEGRVSVVGVSADPSARTYTVEILVPNLGGLLLPGMIAEVRIEGDERVSSLTVPGQAIVRDADEVTRVFVYYPDEERVYGRRIEPGTVYGQEVEVRGGLREGELIVVAGQHELRDGMPARPVEDDEKAARQAQ